MCKGTVTHSMCYSRKEFEKRREISLMGNRITRAAPHLSVGAVQERIRGEKRPWRRQRWEIIYQALTAPRHAEDLARTVGVSPSTVHRVIATYNHEGVAAIETPGKGGRRHQYLTLEQERAFLQPFMARATRAEMATATAIQLAMSSRQSNQLLPAPSLACWNGMAGDSRVSVSVLLRPLKVPLLRQIWFSCGSRRSSPLRR